MFDVLPEAEDARVSFVAVGAKMHELLIIGKVRIRVDG